MVKNKTMVLLSNGPTLRHGFKKPKTWLDRIKEGVQLKVLDFSLQRICERKVVAHKIPPKIYNQ